MWIFFRVFLLSTTKPHIDPFLVISNALKSYHLILMKHKTIKFTPAWIPLMKSNHDWLLHNSVIVSFCLNVRSWPEWTAMWQQTLGWKSETFFHWYLCIIEFRVYLICGLFQGVQTASDQYCRTDHKSYPIQSPHSVSQDVTAFPHMGSEHLSDDNSCHYKASSMT